jgi:hypothetical protein
MIVTVQGYAFIRDFAPEGATLNFPDFIDKNSLIVKL